MIMKVLAQGIFLEAGVSSEKVINMDGFPHRLKNNYFNLWFPSILAELYFFKTKKPGPKAAQAQKTKGYYKTINGTPKPYLSWSLFQSRYSPESYKYKARWQQVLEFCFSRAK